MTAARQYSTVRIPATLIAMISSYAPQAISIERSRLRRRQQCITGVDKSGTRFRLAGKGHELLGEILPAIPRVDLRKRNNLRGGIRLSAEFFGARRRQRRYDCQLGLLCRHLGAGIKDRKLWDNRIDY